MRDRVEIDYTSRLTPEEQSWLASFNEAEYGSNPDCLALITGHAVPTHERQRMWREIKRYQRDVLSTGCRLDIDLVIHLQDSDTRSVEDCLIEMIDRDRELERIAVDHVMRQILSRDWSILIPDEATEQWLMA